MLSSSPFRGDFGPRIMAPLQPSSPVNNENTVPSDFDVSFASSMSISVAGSPPALSPLETCSPMDISPAPTPFLQVPRRPLLTVIQPRVESADYFASKTATSSKGKVFNSIKKRVFGRELSNTSQTSEDVSTPDGVLELPPVPTSASKNPRSRSALPQQWLPKSGDANAQKRRGGVFENFPVWQSAADASPARTDRMDIDMSSPRPGTPAARVSSDENMSPLPAVITAAAQGSDLSSLYEPEVPSSPLQVGNPPSAPKSRRLMPSPPPKTGLDMPSSSPPSSPTVQLKARRMEKFASTGGPSMLFRAPRGSAVPSRRSHPYYRRPSINPTAPELQSAKPLPPPPQSAFAILTNEAGEQSLGPPAPGGLMRRTLSSAPQGDPSSDDPEAATDGSPLGLNVQRAYARRNQARLVTLPDGSPSFRPKRHQTDPDGPSATLPQPPEPDPATPFGPNGLPGFGHNESEGKILPCHMVQDDGLMRITCETLEAVLRGDYDDQLDACHIIDCRFDYEYNGGHIEGAVNLNKQDSIEQYLFGNGCGIAPPLPSRSGHLDDKGSSKKTIIIFHCEFSVKRAPTMAKHIRSKDRTLNAHMYPKVHFPEVYILSGGYCDFFKKCPSLCEPKGYIAMLDPKHVGSCSPSLGEFRAGSRWQRARSYTYGDSMQRPKNVLPFAAAAVALKKRRAGLTPLREDGDGSSSAEDAFGPHGESPCPPSALTRRAAALADPNRPKSLGRGVFDRAVSFRQ